MNKTRSNKLFFCENLFDRENVIYEIRNGFSISNKSGKGLEIFLKESASTEEESNCNRTYVVRDNNTEEIAAYFSLKAGLFSIEADMSENSDDIVSGFDTAPGIELAEFGVNSDYLSVHPGKKGIGLIIFNDFIIPIVKKVQEMIGVKVLYVFALPEEKLINRYIDKYKFCRLDKVDEDNLHNRLKPRFDNGCIFMYQLI